MAITKQLRVLIGDIGDTLAVSIAHELIRYSIWTVIRTQNDAEIIRSVRTERPDILILNLTQISSDIVSLTDQVRQISDIQIMALYRRENLLLESLLRERDIICWRIPANMAELSDVLNRALQPLKQQFTLERVMEPSPLSLEIDVTNLLHAANVPVNLIGFQFLRTAIISGFDNPDGLYNSLGVLYEAIAKQKNTTASRVERCIRSAITQSFAVLPQNSAYFPVQFLSGRKHMTNSEFITASVDWLRLSYSQKNAR